MKHKAKESLDYLGGGFLDDGDIENIQDLINCQLTVEEIDYLCLKLFGCKASNKYCLNWSSEKREEIQKSIEIKMLKQKEMWVSEDE